MIAKLNRNRRLQRATDPTSAFAGTRVVGTGFESAERDGLLSKAGSIVTRSVSGTTQVLADGAKPGLDNVGKARKSGAEVFDYAAARARLSG